MSAPARGRSDSHDDMSRILEKLRPFQREAFDFATKGITYSRQWTSDDTSDRNDAKKPPKIDRDLLGKGRILLCDEMGLGKTVTSLAIMTAYKDEWPLLILCPASLRYTWPAEIEKFLPTIPASAVYVVSGFDDADFFQNEKKRSRIQIVVATYSLLQTRSAAARVLAQFDFKCVIADESHNLKEQKSQRCKLGMPLLQKAKRLVLLSGTPALARPVELWAQVYCVAPKLFGSYTAYTKRYCNAKRGRFGWDVSGMSNADELHHKLCQIMVRRLKSNVLSELPPKQRSIVPINIDTSKVNECRDLMEQLAETKLSVSQLVGSESDQAHFEHRRLLMQAYQASGVGKAKSIAEYLLDWLAGSGTQKILVFAHHQQVMDTLEQAVAKKFKGIGHIRIDGKVPSGERAVRVRKFQTNSQVRVAILSMTAAGVGLTLTAASSVMFAELHWTPGVLAQAEDRCHRIGQENAVNVMYCVCKEVSLSVDTQLWAMLSRKVGTLGKVIDGVNSASLDASESNSDEMSKRQTTSGQSVEDELSRFFAETSANERKQVTSAAPVKGSIMSFFKPPAAKKPTPKVPVNNPSTNPSTGTSKPPAKPPRSSMGDQTITLDADQAKTEAPVEEVEWSCESCTYINSRRKSPNGWLSCELCGNLHGEDDTLDDGSVRAVSPSDPSDPEEHIRNDNAGVLDLSGSSKVSAKRKQSSSEIIAIDVENHVSHGAVTPRLSKKGRRSSKARPTKPGCSSRGKVKEDIDVIEIDLDTESESKSTSSTSDALVIDVDMPPLRTVVTPAQPRKSETASPKRKKTCILNFSLSKNSGRITVHCASTGDSFHINFDIDHLVTRETMDSLLNAKVNRSLANVRASVAAPVVVSFCDNAVKRVVQSLDIGNGKQTSRKTEEQCCDEIKTFVSSYLSLREVEKKALREWNEPVSPIALKQTLSRIMTSSVTAASTERYTGGAKERALSNAKAGTASTLDNSVLAGTACAWCAGRLPDASFAEGIESTYCSQECAEDGRLGRGGMFASTRVRAQVFALEGGVCRKCGIDAHALFTRIEALQPPERLNALCNANWQLPKSATALERLLQRPKEGDFWQADHVVAVASGGGGCSLDNLQTLCTPCHRVETDKLRARLRLTGGMDEGSSAKQMDIRSAFLAQRTSDTKEAT